MENKDLTTFPSGFQLTGPPRAVPLLIRLRLLLGGFLNQFGWIFFGFGLIFVWLFTLEADLTSWYTFRGPLQSAEGTITASRKTNTSVNDTPVYEHQYAFAWEGGRYAGTSYKTGGSTRQPGQAVTVEFPEGKPQVSRIQGMRRGIVGLFGLMPIIFPAVGLCFIVAGFRKGKKGIGLLIFGQPAEGKLISKERTNTRVNKQMVYKLTFEFTASDGQAHTAVSKTHQTRELEDEAAEPILYDPMVPDYAVLLDDLPGRPRIDEMGSITVSSPAGSLTCLLIPAATLIGHGLWLYLKLFV